jgi:hypothetical protein
MLYVSVCLGVSAELADVELADVILKPVVSNFTCHSVKKSVSHDSECVAMRVFVPSVWAHTPCSENRPGGGATKDTKKSHFEVSS